MIKERRGLLIMNNAKSKKEIIVINVPCCLALIAYPLLAMFFFNQGWHEQPVNMLLDFILAILSVLFFLETLRHIKNKDKKLIKFEALK